MLGFTDRRDGSDGLGIGVVNKNIIVKKNLLFCDSRDCVGTQSLQDAQLVFRGRGGREQATVKIKTTTGSGVSPIVVTVQGVLLSKEFRNGDEVSISQVQGNTNANGIWKITGIVYGSNGTFQLVGSIGNDAYTGGGLIIRPADYGYPQINVTSTSTINGNQMVINLSNKLHVIRSLSLVHSVIPRDIIPLEVYLPDFYDFTQFADTTKNPSVYIATTVNGNLATDYIAGNIVDGVVLPTGIRILIKNQTTASENGIYFVQSSGPPVRANDMLAGMSVFSVKNYFVYVENGVTNAGTTWICTNATGVVGTGNLTFSQMTVFPIEWDSYIKMTKEYIESIILGFYSSPLELFRCYVGSFALPNEFTPEPLYLWNPDLVGTGQLKPYPYQTVPTYTSREYTILGRSGTFRLICGGYGVYDLNDWTYKLSESNTVNRILTDIARTLLFFILIPNQYYRDETYNSLIINSNKTSNDLPDQNFGYGDFQRFLPGPGIGTHYQPGTTDNADPTVASTESPIPFPQFRGNVWGPYDSPGDRFQKLGLRDTLQDLFLNGDLDNIFGGNILKPWVSPSQMATDDTFGLYFPTFIDLTFGNIEQATNPNIINAMRLKPNGFGAVTRLAGGNNSTYTWKLKNAGGQGPSTQGTPSSGYNIPSDGGGWVNAEVIDGSTTGQLDDPIACGPQFVPDKTNTLTAKSADATTIGTETTTPLINRRQAWYDTGINNGTFVSQIVSYRNWAIAELPDTNIILQIFQAEREILVQSSNQINSDMMLSVPIRLNLGTTSGTQEYVENIQSLLANSSEYWEKRYFPPLTSLYKLNIAFTTYEGNKIDLEKMLQTRRSVLLLRAYEEIFGDQFGSFFSFVDPRSVALSFLFDPLNPQLIGRTKRNISFIFNIETYEYENPGLLMDTVSKMLEGNTQQLQNNSFTVRASNFEDYAT